VLGIFSVESNFNPDAIGDRHLEDMSWGIGQVRGTTARDFGVNDPRALLDPATGVLTSMRYLKWAWEFLERRQGDAPEIEAWIGSYNAGVGNALRGFTPAAYIARWLPAAGRG
jgi:soluble lytic murein transglycosylase-like protein